MGRTGGGARRRAGDGVRRPGGRPPGRYGVLVGVAAFAGVGRKAAAGMHSMPALEISRLCTTNGVAVGRSPKSVWIWSAADGIDPGGVRSITLKHTMNASGWSGRGFISSGVAVTVPPVSTLGLQNRNGLITAVELLPKASTTVTVRLS